MNYSCELSSLSSVYSRGTPLSRGTKFFDHSYLLPVPGSKLKKNCTYFVYSEYFGFYVLRILRVLPVFRGSALRTDTGIAAFGVRYCWWKLPGTCISGVCTAGDTNTCKCGSLSFIYPSAGGFEKKKKKKIQVLAVFHALVLRVLYCKYSQYQNNLNTRYYAQYTRITKYTVSIS